MSVNPLRSTKLYTYWPPLKVQVPFSGNEMPYTLIWRREKGVYILINILYIPSNISFSMQWYREIYYPTLRRPAISTQRMPSPGFGCGNLFNYKQKAALPGLLQCWVLNSKLFFCALHRHRDNLNSESCCNSTNKVISHVMEIRQ